MNLRKGDLVRICLPDQSSYWAGKLGIYVGQTIEWNKEYGRVFLPWLHRLPKSEADGLSESENLIGHFYTHQLEKIE
jgi:hypothetical protein